MSNKILFVDDEPSIRGIYELLGPLSIYTGRVITYVPLRVKEDASPGPLTLRGQLQYQMCNDKACFPPKRPAINIETTIAPPGTKLEPNHPELFSGFDFSQFAKLMKSARSRFYSFMALRGWTKGC
jgi:hypothetical protein